MKDKKDQRQEEKKVLSIDQYRHHSAEDAIDVGEKSVHQLLKHMQKMRETIPVNHQLQDELRKKLLEKQQRTSESPIKRNTALPLEKTGNSRSMPKLLWVGLALVMLLVLGYLVSNQLKIHSLQPVGTPKEVVKLWNADNNLSFSVAPHDDVLVARHGQLLLANQKTGQYRVLDMATEWLYHSPAISPNGENVALVRQRQGDKPQIVTTPMEKLKISSGQTLDSKGFTVINLPKEFEQYTDLTWSPDGNKLAYTAINKQNDAEVWLMVGKEHRLIAKGNNPTWSPDGTQLVLQREINEKNVLIIVDIEIGTEMLLGEGEQPIWGNNGYLAFIATSQQERVLTFMPDGAPQFTVHQRVGEIRSVFAGNNGQQLKEKLAYDNNWLALSTLLLSPDKGTSNQEMDWLRQMELQGVREPRVLVLDEVEKCHNPVFSNDGRVLFYACQNQGTTAVLQVDVEERPIDRGVK